MHNFFHNGKVDIAQLVTWDRIHLSTDLLHKDKTFPQIPDCSSDTIFKLSGKMCEGNA